jgi:hypothetical protein
MIRPVPVLIMVLVLAAASHASAACRRFGTQLDCDLGASRVVIGTQVADEPTYAGSFRPPPFHGSDRLLDDRAGRGLPFEVDVQDIGADPSLCRKIGNETYCY